MDTYSLYEECRFLGNEFLMWLWFKTDCYDGLLPIQGHGDVEVFFDDHIRLDAYLVDAERSDLKGGSPAYSPEAKTALQQGKRVSKARIRITKEGREWLFNLTGESLDTSSIKIPAVLAKEDDDQFYERMYLLEELEELLETLFQEFVKIRISEHFEKALLPAMIAWTKREDRSQISDYPEVLKPFAQGEVKTTFKKVKYGVLAYDETDDPNDQEDQKDQENQDHLNDPPEDSPKPDTTPDSLAANSEEE